MQLDGDLGDSNKSSRPILVNQPSDAEDFDRASPVLGGEEDVAIEIKDAEGFELDDDEEGDD